MSFRVSNLDFDPLEGRTLRGLRQKRKAERSKPSFQAMERTWIFASKSSLSATTNPNEVDLLCPLN